jgi:acyl-coenzyme A synthetase/AMP-(fatty) acid ligase
MPKTIAITPSWYWPHGVARVTGVPPFYVHEYLVDRWARHRPDDIALIDATGRLTGRELAEQVNLAAAALADRVPVGEHVALAAGPSIEGVVLLLAALGSGTPVRLIDRAMAAPDDGVTFALGDATGVRAWQGSGRTPLRLADLLSSTVPGPTAIRLGRTEAAIAIAAGDSVAWHSHRSLLAGTISLGTFFGARPGRPWLATRALTTWDAIYATTVPLAAGAPLVLAESGEPALDAIGREGVGAAWFDLDNAFDATKDAKKQVKHLRGLLEFLLLSTPGPFSPDKRQRVGRLFECPALTVWGRPETGPVFASHASWYLDESIGIPMTNAHVVPVDPRSGNTISTLWELVESAMVTVWSPSMLVGFGDGSHPERFRDGRFVTGVIASSDANGMIYLLPD